ncbi:hypothetical protein GCM10027169_08860 [Gordonia jinhuaensis]|uniref:ABC transporter domain-containing protein n=1 Tax=Gordonia jinhuaensis TaxID=1517702 RepID=A0A916X0W5_9ACTN|nr:hypothetical protein GCM10011489_35410 [Gordonia jinhuaensis]
MAALADVAAAVCVIGRIIPITGAAILIAAVPFGIVAVRRRLRAAVLALVTGWTVAFLFGGYSAANLAASAALFGGFIGIALRRRWSPGTVVLAAIGVIAVPAAAVSLALVSIFADYREFMFTQVRNGWRGIARLLTNGNAEQVSHFGSDVIGWILDNWVITIPVFSGVGVAVAALMVYFVDHGIVAAIASRLAPPVEVADTEPSDTPDTCDTPDPAIAPVPVQLRDVGFTYPGAVIPVFSGVDLTVVPGEVLAISGPNGAGKSTLAPIIAGAAPTTGDVRRPGGLGYGRTDGTAVVGQRPETGVLGMRVADELEWGTDGLDDDVIEALLHMVGLDGMAGAETASLSGGQLQRLAIAGALVRRPALLVSDESTAMLDTTGRREIMALYRRLAREYRVAVVHVTHDPDDLAAVDRVYTLRGHPARQTESGYAGVPVQYQIPQQYGTPTYRWGGRVVARGLGFAHDAGTPWEKPVFEDFSMSVQPGETVLVTGPNGVGKSTLARLLVGAERPTAGMVQIDDEPTRNARDAALLGHQFARLSLIRGRVREEVRDAAGVDDAGADRALVALGLNPQVYGDARVNELSVGQQRRVALAGLMASRPRVLVLDEPLAGLDEASRSAMVAALASLKADGITIIVVTHDIDPFAPIADRVVALPRPENGVAAIRTRSRASLVNVVGRVLPYDSPAKRLWAGTKVSVLLIMALMFAINPSWWTVLVGVIVALAWTALGRVRRRAIPRLPWWFVLAAVIGGLITSFGGGEPYVSVVGVRFGLGGASSWATLLMITLTSLYMSLLLCWTTPMVEIPSLLQQVASVARRIRLGSRRVDLRAATVSVSVALRMAPAMIANLRILAQTISQRRSGRGESRWARIDSWFHVLGVACSLAVSDAADTAATMVTRGGGMGRVARTGRRPGAADAVVVAVVLAAAVAACVLG